MLQEGGVGSGWSEIRGRASLDSRFQRRLPGERMDWATNRIIEISSWYKYTALHALTLLAGHIPGILPIMLIHFLPPDSAITFFNRAARFEVDTCDLVILLLDLLRRSFVRFPSATASGF